MSTRNGSKALMVTLVASLVVTGCATKAQTGAGIGALIGCGIGTIVAKKTGGDAATGCAAGLALGAGVGYYIGRQKDLELARAAEQEIRTLNAGADVQVKTRRQDVPEEQRKEVGGATSIEVVDAMVVAVPQNLVAKQDPRAVTTLSKVGGYVSQSSTKSNVVVSARSKQEYDFMVAAMQKGYPQPVGNDKVVYTYQQANSRANQATVEVRPVETSMA